MPNWTWNKATYKGEKQEVERLKALMGPEFDFNGIIPMPKSLDVTCGSITDEALVFYVINRDNCDPEKDAVFLRQHVFGLPGTDRVRQTIEMLEKKSTEMSAKEADELFSLGKTYYENIINYGCSTWYDWCTKHWGTKWPASEVSMTEEPDGSVTWEFFTAWCCPMPVYRKIEEEFPDLTYSIAYTDEDDPYNEYVINHVPSECE